MFNRKVVGVSLRTLCRATGDRWSMVLLGLLLAGCNGSLDIGNPDINVETGDTNVDVTTNVDQTQDVTVNVGDSESPTAVVNVSPSTDVSRGQEVTLDASASTPGTGGGSLSFTWSEVTGFGVVIRGATTAVATAEIPPDMDDGETIVIRVQVTAGQRADTTEVRLTVIGGPPEDEDADDADSSDGDIEDEDEDEDGDEAEDDVDEGLCLGEMCPAGQTCDPDTGDCLTATAVIYVDASASAGGDGLSWATAYDDIQPALAEAINLGGSFEVWVARGTYTPAGPGGDRSASFNMLNNVELLGGFAGAEISRSQRDIAANETILSGDLDGDDLPLFGNRGDNSFHILAANGVATTAVLDGFTIRGGNAGDLASPDNSGGGLFITNTGSPVILNCLFRENEANGNDGNGGAIAGLSSPSRVENSVFTDNSASGSGGAVFGRSGDFIDCTFTSNRASQFGGAVSWFTGNGAGFGGRFIDCMFSDNHSNMDGGALVLSRLSGSGFASCTGCTFIGNSADAEGADGGACNGGTFANCRFLGNTAFSGGGAITSSRDIVNCEFSGNQARDGGAIWESVPVTNCTFSNNSAARDGGALLTSPGGFSRVENCVFWNNTDQTGGTESAQIRISFGGMGNVFNSLIQGLSVFAGNGNISQNPQFVDPLGPDGIAGTLDDDLRLMSNSPAIDAGDNASLLDDTLDVDGDGDLLEATPLDLDGTPRIKNGTVDMGAYENGQ